MRKMTTILVTTLFASIVHAAEWTRDLNVVSINKPLAADGVFVTVSGQLGILGCASSTKLYIRPNNDGVTSERVKAGYTMAMVALASGKRIRAF